MRTVLFALVIALGGGAYLLGGLKEIVLLQADGSSSDAGSRFDPNGSMSGAGRSSNAEVDAGSHYDPNG